VSTGNGREVCSSGEIEAAIASVRKQLHQAAADGRGAGVDAWAGDLLDLTQWKDRADRNGGFAAYDD